jgi:hypothetical protein
MAKWFIEITLRKNIQSMKRSILALVLLGTLAATAPAAVTTLNPSVDGWADHGASNGSNDNSTDPLIVSNTANSTRSYLRFAIPSHPGAAVNSVTLILRLTQAPLRQNGPGCPCVGSRTYELYKSSGTIPDSWAGLNIFNTVPDSSDLGGVSTGTVSDVNLQWADSALKIATQSLFLGAGGDLALVIHDLPETGPRYEGHLASNENATAAYHPQLVIDYTEDPPPTCNIGSVVIMRHDYTGQNPLAWGSAYTVGFNVSFTVTAGCKDLVSLKIQGGLASNTTTNVSQWWTCNGSDPCTSNENIPLAPTYKSVGQGNKVITWNINSLPANHSVTITIPVWASYNNQSLAACGTKNFTGGWSVTGLWSDGNTLHSASDGHTGSLVVDLLCPVTP